MLRECRSQCDYLIVGLQTDPSIDRKEKNKPIQSIEEREIQVTGCRFVDEIIRYDTEAYLLKILTKFSDHNSMYPGKYVRFIGADWKGKPFTGHELKGLPVIFNSRDHTYSSSNLRERVFIAELAKKCLEQIVKPA